MALGTQITCCYRKESSFGNTDWWKGNQLMGMNHILPPNQVVHLAQNGSWRDRFTVCAAGKVSGKGNRSTEVKTLLKYIQLVPWALELMAPVPRCWLTFNWTMQSFHQMLDACFTWDSPGGCCRVLSAVSHQAAFAPVLVPALVPSPALQER